MSSASFQDNQGDRDDQKNQSNDRANDRANDQSNDQSNDQTDQPIDQEDWLDRLVELEALIQEVVQQADQPAIQDPVRRFLEGLYQVGLVLTAHPNWQTAPPWQQFLDRTAPLLQAALPSLFEFLGIFENSLYGIWEGDWQRTCEQRSSLEFLQDFYQQTVLAASLPELELPELDHVLREVAHREGYIAPEMLPVGIPRSHWWWFTS